MSMQRLKPFLTQELENLRTSGRAKGRESIITRIIPAEGEQGPRYLVAGRGDQQYIKMNSNSYLGLSFHPEMIAAEEKAVQEYGVGPGAVRFISGTHAPHRELEKRLARFHSREDAMIFSAAYVTVVGVLSSLISADTVVISDELNHNCIINAIKLSRPADKKVYKHNDMAGLQQALGDAVGKGKRVLVVTDGIFSMRGDYAPLDQVCALAKQYDDQFEQGVLVVVDDSHGVGAFGATGRGTVEYTQAEGVDVLIGTLGKAFGVNGGYVTGDQTLITYLREHAITYIYSNPITVAEAVCAHTALDILDSDWGQKRLDHLRAMTKKFEDGIVSLGCETISSEHPVVPLVVRDTQKTRELGAYLFEHGVLATGLNYPVVPEGSQSIRFQVNADHTPRDIDAVLGVLAAYQKTVSF
ncbi:MAG TPA: pyridoxal phosphate-dependent aminotransferase family protein [bacterium]|nr:pyridoxal phosphate-dependent aminotransferase family protein [bacterium]